MKGANQDEESKEKRTELADSLCGEFSLESKHDPSKGQRTGSSVPRIRLTTNGFTIGTDLDHGCREDRKR